MTGQVPVLGEGFVDAGGDCIHYVEQGHGPPVLLIHGAFGSGTRFITNGLGTTLSAHHRVIAPDSLGHGGSDAPHDPARYSARRRAYHLASVLDALDVDRVHVVGYSMGGWMASALAAYHPDRIASLAIGGWDVERGMYTPAELWGLPEITYDVLGAMVRRDRPELIDWLRPEDEPALAAAVNGMNDLEGLGAAVADCPAPVMLWMGEADHYYASAVRFSARHGIPLAVFPGDHISMLDQHGADAAGALGRFIAAVENGTVQARAGEPSER